MKMRAVWEDEMLDILRNADMIWFEKNVYRFEMFEKSDGSEWAVAYFHAPDTEDPDYVSPITGKPTDNFSMRLPKGGIDAFLKEWKSRM